MAIQLLRRRFTVGEYDRIIDAGILGEDDRVELLEGEIVETAPIGSRHAACVKRLNQLFSRQAAGRFIVAVQDPIRLDEFSEPQPDLAILRPRPDFYSESHPGPEDILLVVEVSDTSADYDRAVKAPIYGTAAIPEVWLVDLAAGAVEVHREPVSGSYSSVEVAPAGSQVSPRALPDITVQVSAIVS